MYRLIRLLFRKLEGKPTAQIIVGIIMIPLGGLISIAAMFANSDYIYPYWIVAGIAIAVVGVVFIVRGAKARLQPKPSVQQAVYSAPGQYAPQQPYAPQAAYGQPQMPYAQPQAQYSQPYPSEYIPGQQPQAPYGQALPPYTPGQ